MSDLLSLLDKSNIHSIFDDIHDTFARDIKIFVAEDQVFLDTDGNHNPLYGDNKETIVTEYKTYDKKARIKYIEEQDRSYGVGTDSNINLNFPKGKIRLKVDEETYKLIITAKKIKVDDRLCELITSPSRPGPFNPNYWTIILKQID